MNMVQVGILGVVGVLLAVQLKQERAEVAIYLSIGISILIFFGILEHLQLLVQAIKEIHQFTKLEGNHIVILIKMLGITYLAEFSSGICKDAGHQTVATQIEMFGKITILVLSLPVLLALLRTIQEFLS